jgi:hypothetical protein
LCVMLVFGCNRVLFGYNGKSKGQHQRAPRKLQSSTISSDVIRIASRRSQHRNTQYHALQRRIIDDNLSVS